MTVDVPQEVLEGFAWPDQITVAPYGHGLINGSFLVTAVDAVGVPSDGRSSAPLNTGSSTRRFILQRINASIFPDPAGLMENIRRVTTHLRAEIAREGGDARETMSILPSRSGDPFLRDAEGNAWRVFGFVEGTICYEKAETPDQFRAAGEAFGTFLRRLDSFPAETLHETIPAFHDSRRRFEQFVQAVEADVCGRADGVRAEIAYGMDREDDCARLMDLYDEGLIPLRVTHNDTKLSNVLIDARTDKGLCVIDLDTVMPGIALHDFGDALRYGASTAGEDEPDTSLIRVDLAMCEAFAEGYMAEAGSILTGREKDNLAWGFRAMVLEQALRFLADYLRGDDYYSIRYVDHNLVRTRAQFALLADLENRWDELVAAIGKYA